MIADLRIETKGIQELQQFLLAMEGKANRPTAVAMTRTAKLVQEEVKRVTPQFVDKPTAWTMRSTFVKPAKPNKLTAIVGFKDYSNTGVPAAEYLQPIAAGGTRKLKPFEQRLRERGILQFGQFAAPSGIAPFKFNQYGNLSGPQHLQVLSRLRALREVGSTQNATNSARSRRKRQALSVFAIPDVGIFARQGRKVTPAFFFINQPRYQATFPIARIMRTTFEQNWSAEFEKAIQAEMDYQAKKARG